MSSEASAFPLSLSAPIIQSILSSVSLFLGTSADTLLEDEASSDWRQQMCPFVDAGGPFFIHSFTDVHAGIWTEGPCVKP